jgi:hypothetical protein
MEQFDYTEAIPYTHIRKYPMFSDDPENSDEGTFSNWWKTSGRDEVYERLTSNQKKFVDAFRTNALTQENLERALKSLQYIDETKSILKYYTLSNEQMSYYKSFMIRTRFMSMMKERHYKLVVRKLDLKIIISDLKIRWWRPVYVFIALDVLAFITGSFVLCASLFA